MFRSLAALAVAVLLAGCSTAPAGPTGSVGSPAASPAASSADTPLPQPSMTMQVIEISLKDGKVSPNGDRFALAKYTILRLKITSDRNDEVHVHGYDVEIPVKAGASVTKDITLEQVGRFEIESHDPPLTILQLVVS